MWGLLQTGTGELYGKFQFVLNENTEPVDSGNKEIVMK